MSSLPLFPHVRLCVTDILAMANAQGWNRTDPRGPVHVFYCTTGCPCPVGGGNLCDTRLEV